MLRTWTREPSIIKYYILTHIIEFYFASTLALRLFTYFYHLYIIILADRNRRCTVQ